MFMMLVVFFSGLLAKASYSREKLETLEAMYFSTRVLVNPGT
jgi:hypothetical protein